MPRPDPVELVLPPQARRLDTVPISAHVYGVLRDAICEGRFEPYARLVQNQLADQLKVSRTPVRDALLRLAQEGLIESIGARGYVVRELTLRDILDVYEVRLALEVLAADLTLPEITDGDLREARRLHEEIAKPEAHPDDYFELNRLFHSSLVASCSNRLLVSLLEQIWDLPVSRRMFGQYVSTEEIVEQMVREHGEILEAATDRDRDRYLAIVRGHLVNARDGADRWLESQASDLGEPEAGRQPSGR